MTATVLLGGAGFLLAWANGANDVSKGVSTLVGGGTAGYRAAILWGSAWTGAGALLGAVVAGAMVDTFGRGLLVPGTAPTVAAGVATTLGAALWVLFATRTSRPVSTTHAVVGALVGAAAVTYGPASLQWEAVLRKIALPLLVSPVLALGVTLALARMSPWARGGEAVPDCVCVGLEEPGISAGATVVALSQLAGGPRVVVDTASACAVEGSTTIALTVDRAHWISSGLVSFARGLNDAPKLAVLMLASGAAGALGTGAMTAFAVVAAGMTLGSLAGGRRITRVLAEDVTPMGRHGAFVANAVTALMVGAGAYSGLPMSTTHVSSGGIVGLGIAAGGGSVHWGTVRRMLAAWVVTLPVAAALGAFGAACALHLPR